METVQQLNAALDRKEIDAITWAREMAKLGYDTSVKDVVNAFRDNPKQSAAELLNTVSNAATLPMRAQMEQAGKAANWLGENINKPGGPKRIFDAQFDAAKTVVNGAGEVFRKMMEGGNGRTLYGDGKFPGDPNALRLPAGENAQPTNNYQTRARVSSNPPKVIVPPRNGKLAQSNTKVYKNTKMSPRERKAAIEGILNAQAEMADNESYLARENGGRARVVGAYTNSKRRLVKPPNESALYKMSDSQLRGLRDSISNDFYKDLVSGKLPASLETRGGFRYNNSPSGGRYKFTARKPTAIGAKKQRTNGREWNPETEEFIEY